MSGRGLEGVCQTRDRRSEEMRGSWEGEREGEREGEKDTKSLIREEAYCTKGSAKENISERDKKDK
jgi:hypothetical protein